MLNSLYKKILDLIFPQTDLEEEIHNLSSDQLSLKLSLKERGSVVSLFTYSDPLIRAMIWRLKYKRDTHVARLFAHNLSDYLMEELSDGMIFSEGIRCVIIPLPLSKKRERERGYNQITLITDALQTCGEYTVSTDILKRIRHTPPQTSLRKKEDRASNISGVFEVRNNVDLKDTHIILIDDVLTTGSTLMEAQQTLKENGVYNVSCIALTH